MRKSKQTKGITLVALILTIVILLILAVVTIRSIQGEGIISKAIQSREKYEKAADEEQGILDKYSQEMETISDGKNSSSNEEEKEETEEEKWNKGAASADAFIWKSDDPTSPDYGVVIGYTANADNYSILRYPTRCTKITLEYDSERYAAAQVGGTKASRTYSDNIKK